jgi:hypothetical protein
MHGKVDKEQRIALGRKALRPLLLSLDCYHPNCEEVLEIGNANEEHVFFSESGFPLTRRAIDMLFLRTRERANLPKDKRISAPPSSSIPSRYATSCSVVTSPPYKSCSGKRTERRSRTPCLLMQHRQSFTSFSLTLPPPQCGQIKGVRKIRGPSASWSGLPFHTTSFLWGHC